MLITHGGKISKFYLRCYQIIALVQSMADVSRYNANFKLLYTTRNIHMKVVDTFVNEKVSCKKINNVPTLAIFSSSLEFKFI